MRLVCAIIMFSISASGAWVGNLWSPRYGDARRASEMRDMSYTNGHPGMVEVEVPNGEWHGITVTMWLRFGVGTTNYSAKSAYVTTAAFWCPERILRSAPDLTGGAFGYPNGTNLSGSASLAFDFVRESGYAPSNVFARGAYTIAGWSSNAVAVALGGEEITVGPGAFNRNSEPGAANGITVSGTGPVAVAVSRLHAHQFFGGIGGVQTNNSDIFAFIAETVITNELLFAVFRIRLDATNHIYRADMCHLGGFDPSGQVKTNALPDDPSVRAICSGGIYRFGMVGMGVPGGTWRFDVFDARVQPSWLPDSEVQRIYSNGSEEIGRRPVPRWR